MVVANHEGLYVHQMDVTSAFLWGDKEETVYLSAPADFKIGEDLVLAKWIYFHKVLLRLLLRYSINLINIFSLMWTLNCLLPFVKRIVKLFPPLWTLIVNLIRNVKGDNDLEHKCRISVAIVWNDWLKTRHMFRHMFSSMICNQSYASKNYGQLWK